MKMKQLILFLFFFPIFSWSQEVFVIMERPQKKSFDYLKTREDVARNWGIVYKTVAENQSLELEDSMALHNAMVYYQLNDKFGPNWEKDLETEIQKALAATSELFEELQVRHNGVSEFIQMNGNQCLGVRYETNERGSESEPLSYKVIKGTSDNYLFNYSSNILAFNFRSGVNYRFETTNCQLMKLSSSKTLPPYSFNVINVNQNERAFLKIFEDGKESTSFVFQTVNRPLPMFHFCSFTSGMDISKSQLKPGDELSLIYPKNIQMIGYHSEIIEWELQYQDKRVGNIQYTNQLDASILEIIQTIPENSPITIFYKMQSEEGRINTAYMDAKLVP